jgi:glycosyltransferase involved in cell wall biosynthesis
VRIRYLLTNAYAAGGTVRTVVNQANALCADHDVEIASVYRYRDTPSFEIDPRVRLRPLTELRTDGRPRDGSFRLLRKARRFHNPMVHGVDFRYAGWDPGVDLAIVRYFRSLRDAVLVTTRPALNLLSARYAPQRLIRVGQDHMNFGAYKPPLQKAIRATYPKLDAVTVLTRHDLAEYRAALHGTDVLVERVPNGIPVRTEPSAALDAPVIVAAGEICGRKGFDLLIEAFQLVSAAHPEWELRIFGSGPRRDRFLAMDRTGKVSFPGQAKDLDAEFRRASIFVLSSRREGLPMVLLESQTAGLPAVSFDCPTGPAEVIENGHNGLLIPPEDPAALAAGIRELIGDRERRRAMGAAALRTSAQFSIPRITTRWEELFARLGA